MVYRCLILMALLIRCLSVLIRSIITLVIRYLRLYKECQQQQDQHFVVIGEILRIMAGYRADTLVTIQHGSGGQGSGSFTVPAFTSPVPQIMVFTNNVNTVSGQVGFYMNGTNYGVAFPGSAYFFPSTGYLIGSNANGLNLYNGYIGEIIIFNRQLKVSEIKDVQKYLAKKWQLNCCMD